MRRLTINSVRANIPTVLAAAAVVAGLAACDNSGPSAATKEANSNRSAYAKLVDLQPGHTMTYSPTRNTINFWIDTWNHPNKLSYVYLQNAEGKITGYYVLKGLPVSYCAALKPTVQERQDDTGGNLLIPQPSADGVYYSGGQCNTYYGEDATSGAYVEWTAGLGINVLLYDQPLPPNKAPGAVALGPTVVKNGKPVK